MPPRVTSSSEPTPAAKATLRPTGQASPRARPRRTASTTAALSQVHDVNSVDTVRGGTVAAWVAGAGTAATSNGISCTSSTAAAVARGEAQRTCIELWYCWVEVRGFEPLASSVRGKRSTGLSHTPRRTKLPRSPRALVQSFTASGRSTSAGSTTAALDAAAMGCRSGEPTGARSGQGVERSGAGGAVRYVGSGTGTGSQPSSGTAGTAGTAGVGAGWDSTGSVLAGTP